MKAYVFLFYALYGLAHALCVYEGVRFFFSNPIKVVLRDLFIQMHNHSDAFECLYTKRKWCISEDLKSKMT